MKFSANIGFLWRDLPLPARIRAAAKAGFDAVECHFPYDVDPAETRAALTETGLPMLGLNTRTGGPGDVGLAALKGREDEARAAIDEAAAYAATIGARNIHVMAGVGGDRATFVANLAYAAAQAPERTILIEPLNRRDAPGYFLTEVEQAALIVAEAGAPNVKIMFDCYHVQIMQGDLIRRAGAHMPLIGHVQFAACPSRAEPDEGEIACERVLPALRDAGYTGYFGAEYTPRGRVEDGLGWLARMREG